MYTLEIKNLNIAAGDFRVLDVNLDIKKQEYFILMGHTGSGKSLMLKSICGIQPIMSGQILINNEDMALRPPESRRLGYVPQNSGLFPHLDVQANIVFGMDLLGFTKEQAKEAMNKIVSDMGIEKLLGRHVGTLSGGEKQKVALARALIRKPVMLLLDEPVSALDEIAREEICNLLDRIHVDYQLTTLHICHSRDEAHMMGHRIGIMNAGKLAVVGTVSELRECQDDPLVSKLFRDR